MAVIDYFQARGASLRRTDRDPRGEPQGAPYRNRAEFYADMEAYYRNDVYASVRRHRRVLNDPDLPRPRYLRNVYSPVKRAIDRWPSLLYPGVWTPDGLPTKNGTPNRIPYDDTPEPLRLAVHQAFTWGGWNSEILVYGRRLPLLAESFAEVQVDFERRMAYPRLIHPRHVVDIAENDSGDVVAYTLAIPTFDEDKNVTYTWGKRVTKETITTYYDGQPHGFDGNPAVLDNPYGFCPGDWVQFQNMGERNGISRFDGLTDKIDELNGILTAIHDYIMKFVHQRHIIGTEDPAGAKALMDGTAKAGATRDLANPNARRESIDVLFAKHPVSAHPIIDNMGLAEADSHVQRLIDQLEKDLPEVTLSEKLLEMSQVTKPGALPLVQDVQQFVNEVAGNADRGLTKMGQMSVSIMAHEMRAGTMGPRSQWTDAMRKFLPFDLDSYHAGDLDFSLSERELVPPTMLERIQEAAAMELIKTPSGLRHLGFSDDDIWGEGLAPETRAGLLAERDDAAGGVADLFGRALNSGVV